MSGKPPERSNLIDITYSQLHSILSGRVEGTSQSQLTTFLTPRLDRLRNALSEPFGRPSDASRAHIKAGKVTLRDGVQVQVEDADKEYVFAISSAFQIDEIEALILFRSFLYNQGLPLSQGEDLVEQLVDHITPFYFSERQSILRVLIPLLRARETSSDRFHQLSLDVLPTLIPDGLHFARELLEEYQVKIGKKLPEKVEQVPRVASRWVKQSAKEQLICLEVLFWTMWGFVPCGGQIVEQIFTLAYDTQLGSITENATLLLDDEGVQLQRDINALWVLITIEVLELEIVAEPGHIEFSDSLDTTGNYTASPDCLERMHTLVMSKPGNEFACTFLAWTFVLSRIISTASDLTTIPPRYRSFLDRVMQPGSGYVSMTQTCIDPRTGVLGLMLKLLDTSPLFGSVTALRLASSVTDPNAIAFRSVFKGLVIGLLELVPVEHISEFETLIDVWISLFGQSEIQSVAGICRQFWEADWHHGVSRRALFDVARSRFPVQVGPLVRLLRSMTASGFFSNDPLSSTSFPVGDSSMVEDRDLCQRHVFYFFDNLPTYSQVIPLSACTGIHALYERQQERFGASGSSGLTYTNLHDLGLPGHTVLPARSLGLVLSSEGGEFLVVSWTHRYSGWRLLLDILAEYVSRDFTSYPVQHAKLPGNHLSLQDAGVNLDQGISDKLIIDILDLVRSLIQDDSAHAARLLHSIDQGSDRDSSVPDLVKLTTMVLEHNLRRMKTSPNADPATQLIVSAITVLSAILAIPAYSTRVWLFIRSSSLLFGSSESPGFTSNILSAERMIGQYSITRAILHLAEQLFEEALHHATSNDTQLRKLKENILLRALRFVHSEIWVEHLGWKYTQISDRFEIGQRVAALFLRLLSSTPLSTASAPYQPLSDALIDILLLKATTSTIIPLVSSITSGCQLLASLYSSRRFGDAQRLIYMLQSQLALTSQVLSRHVRLAPNAALCLLGQVLCMRNSGDLSRSKMDPIDALAILIKERRAGNSVPLEATRVLAHLSTSISVSKSSLTLIAHLSNPESFVTSLVQIVRHPYDDLLLRQAVWDFIIISMNTEPALARLFAVGQFHSEHPLSQVQQQLGGTTAFDVAKDAVANWKALWEFNPQILATTTRFLHSVWQHALEHKELVQKMRDDSPFWAEIVGIACAEVGPPPDYQSQTTIFEDGVTHSEFHETVTMHCYRTSAKTFAVGIVGLDLSVHATFKHTDSQPISFRTILSKFRSEEELTDLLSEAAPNSYQPEAYDSLTAALKPLLPAVSIDDLHHLQPPESREYGDDFRISWSLLNIHLCALRSEQELSAIEHIVHSVNLNLSLSHCQTRLAESWDTFLRHLTPYLRGDKIVRPILLSVAASISFDIARESRRGEMASYVHKTRMSFLQAIMELAWFSESDTALEIKFFVELADNVRSLVINEDQPPLESFSAPSASSFHRPLLNLLFICSRFARNLILRPKAITSEQRSKISMMNEASVQLAIDALRIVFIAAQSRLDLDLDSDMQLLVAVFEHCTRSDINPSSSMWLGRCQETGVINASFDLYVHLDLLGLSDISLLVARKQPLYVTHILSFHTCLASRSSAAERLASDGIIAAYSNNSLSPVISMGRVDVKLAELPGERSPAHFAYCSMLAVLSGVISAVGRDSRYFDIDACGLIQLYGAQIERALSWTIGDSLTIPLLEEQEQVVQLFYSLAENAATQQNVNENVAKLLQTFTHAALRLIQQLNYAVSHPNHISALFEPVTPEERQLLEKHPISSDPSKHPLISIVLRRMFRLSSDVICTLISISRAVTVLNGEKETWPKSEPTMIPHSKVVLGELASMGTLLELGNCTLDLMKELSTPVTKPPSSDTESKGTVIVARRNLEAIILYTVTQLAMWLAKTEGEKSISGEMDIDDVPLDQTFASRGDRWAARPNLRKGMIGELASDLQSLLNRAKPVLASGEGADLTKVMTKYLNERIVVPLQS